MIAFSISGAVGTLASLVQEISRQFDRGGRPESLEPMVEKAVTQARRLNQVKLLPKDLPPLDAIEAELSYRDTFADGLKDLRLVVARFRNADGSGFTAPRGMDIVGSQAREGFGARQWKWLGQNGCSESLLAHVSSQGVKDHFVPYWTGRIGGVVRDRLAALGLSEVSSPRMRPRLIPLQARFDPRSGILRQVTSLEDDASLPRGMAVARFFYSTQLGKILMEDRLPDPDNPESFAATLRQLRGEAGLSREELSALLSEAVQGVSSQELEEWEEGMYVPWRGIPWVAAALSCQLGRSVLESLDEARSHEWISGETSRIHLTGLMEAAGLNVPQLSLKAKVHGGVLRDWWEGHSFPNIMVRTRIVWILAAQLRRAPDQVWRELHQSDPCPPLLQLAQGVEVPLAPCLMQLINELHDQKLR